MNKPDERIQELFDFHLLNGNGSTEIKDVVLTAKTQEVCREVIKVAKQLPVKIRNEVELQLFIESLTDIRSTLKKLREAKIRKKEPYIQINQKIESAAWQIEMELGNLNNSLKDEIARWEEMRRVGAANLQDQLLEKAKEKELAAKYSDNPQKKKKAHNEALLLKGEAKKVAPQPTAGIATHYGWRFKETSNKQTAMRTHPEFFEIDDDVVNRAIKDLEKRGEKLNEHSFPGLELERYSWVTFRR